MTVWSHIAGIEVLDNAGWYALNGPHAALAEGEGRARRYRPDVAGFHATADDDERTWADLAELASDGVEEHGIVLFRAETPVAPGDWEVVSRGEGHQMVQTDPTVPIPALPEVDPATGERVSLRTLHDGDVDDMLALVALTQPGPFRPRTIELGGYVGVFHDDRLVAMAGQRLHPPGFCEVSAVCTHPDARRRGYASVVTLTVAAGIRARGEVPFLHVAATNTSARAVYAQIGFEHRRLVSFGLYRAPELRREATLLEDAVRPVPIPQR